MTDPQALKDLMSPPTQADAGEILAQLQRFEHLDTRVMRLIHEAASLIERQAQDVAYWKEQATELGRTRQRNEAEIERLREARKDRNG